MRDVFSEYLSDASALDLDLSDWVKQAFRDTEEAKEALRPRDSDPEAIGSDIRVHHSYKRRADLEG